MGCVDQVKTRQRTWLDGRLTPGLSLDPVTPGDRGKITHVVTAENIPTIGKNRVMVRSHANCRFVSLEKKCIRWLMELNASSPMGLHIHPPLPLLYLPVRLSPSLIFTITMCLVETKVEVIWLVGFLTPSSTTRLYRGRAPRQSV